tara:strand:+ start:327 stop:491 length:165 start_codon:yes stop_codon:yes gene_type:complete
MFYLIEVEGVEADGTAELGKPLAIASTKDGILKARMSHIEQGRGKRSLLIKEVS